ncbi:MAG: hypothetical protein ACR2HE_00760 [Casimicrobiaceae bacterium]
MKFQRPPLGAALAAAFAFAATCAPAAPLAPARVVELCANADGQAHCGRLIEAEQLKALPNLAVRDGDALRVSLFPAGVREFVDVDTIRGSQTYSLWDYWGPINAVVLFTTNLDRTGYAVLQRATGQLTALPAEPVLAPDRQRLAIADFCAKDCENDITVWRVTREGVRGESAWKPRETWTDVTVYWKDAATLAIEHTLSDGKTLTLERRLADPGWSKFDAR